MRWKRNLRVVTWRGADEAADAHVEAPGLNLVVDPLIDVDIGYSNISIHGAG